MNEQLYDLLKNNDIRQVLELLRTGNSNAALILADHENESEWLRATGREASMKEYTDELVIRIRQLIEEGDGDRFLDDVRKETAHSGGKGNGPKMFLSYNSNDYATAKAMMTYLRDCDFNLFFDKISMIPGDDIRSRVAQEILDRDFFVVLLSENSLRSSWLCLESTIANTKLLTQTNRVIPIRLDRSLDNPKLLDDIRRSIDDSICEMDEQLQKNIKEHRLDRDLVEARFRRDDFRKQHGSMVETYRSLAGIDISGDQFEEGMRQLVESLRSLYNK